MATCCFNFYAITTQYFGTLLDYLQGFLISNYRSISATYGNIKSSFQTFWTTLCYRFVFKWPLLHGSMTGANDIISRISVFKSNWFTMLSVYAQEEISYQNVKSISIPTRFWNSSWQFGIFMITTPPCFQKTEITFHWKSRPKRRTLMK